MKNEEMKKWRHVLSSHCKLHIIKKEKSKRLDHRHHRINQPIPILSRTLDTR
jgi:hypothetical protein